MYNSFDYLSSIRGNDIYKRKDAAGVGDHKGRLETEYKC